MTSRIESMADASLRHALSKAIAETNDMIAATLDDLRGAARPMPSPSCSFDTASLIE